MSEMPQIPPRMGSSIGQPMTRRDGRLKVTGAATFAADNRPEGLLYAVQAIASIARGRVLRMDEAAALAHPGVVKVFTPWNTPPFARDPEGKEDYFDFRFNGLQTDKVRFAGQAVALVVAETLEAATEGAALLAPVYEAEPPRVDLDREPHYEAPTVSFGMPSRSEFGDLEAGFAKAETRIEAQYATPAHYHNQMEPHAVVANWDGDRLTLDIPSQGIGHLGWSAGTPEFRHFVRSRFEAHYKPLGPERLYLSRTRLENEDSLVDQEGQIEMMMAAAGYTIFHPERYSIRQQVEHLMAARMVVGADGSAFHLAAHVLQPGTRVGLIKRRHRTEVFNAIARQIVAFSGVELSTLHPLLPEEEGRERARLNLHRLERALKRKGFL